MWLCLSNSFLSIVAHRDQPDQLLVRARARGHIEAIFPGASVLETRDADYGFRAVVPRTEAAEVIRRQVEGIDYPNFKDSVRDRRLHDAYMAFWSTMYRLQQQERE